MADLLEKLEALHHRYEEVSTQLSDPTAVNPRFTVDVTGTYVAQLIVNDGMIDSAPDTVTINWENSQPLADAGDDATAYINDEVTLDGSGSTGRRRCART